MGVTGFIWHDNQSYPFFNLWQIVNTKWWVPVTCNSCWQKAFLYSQHCLLHCAVGIQMLSGLVCIGILPTTIWPHASRSISPQSTVQDNPCVLETVNPAVPCTYSSFIIHADMCMAPMLMFRAHMQCLNFCSKVFTNVGALSPRWGFPFVVCWIQVFLPSFSLD